MSPIGQYIYLTQGGYEKGERGFKKKDATMAFYHKHHDYIVDIASKGSSSIARQIQTDLNNVFTQQEGKSSIQEKSFKECFDFISANVGSLIPKLGNRAIDFSRLTLQMFTDNETGISMRNKIRMSEDSKRKSKKTIETIIHNLDSALDIIKAETSQGFIDAEKLEKDLEKIKTEISKIDDACLTAANFIRVQKKQSRDGKVTQFFVDRLNDNGKKIKQILYKVEKDSSGKKIAESGLFAEINKLIGTLSAISMTLIGDIAEYSIGAAVLYLYGNIAENFESQLKNVVRGQSRSAVGYSSANFASGTTIENVKNAKKGITTELLNISDGDVTITSKAVQEKIDISFTLNEKIINASIKNYNLSTSSHIKLISGSALLNMLQNENSEHFVDHYINYSVEMSKKEITKRDKKGHIKAHKTIVLPPLMTLPIKKEIEEILLIKALTGSGMQRFDKQGNGFKMSTADYFIINDNSKAGNIKVYPMSTLFEIISKTSSYSIDGDLNDWYKKGLNAYEPLRGNEKNNDSAIRRRINRILSALHQKKIAMSFKTSALS